MARPRKFDEATRTALIRHAAEQIVAGGVESVSLRPLAAQQGCSTTAIYTMFGSRDGLIKAVVKESVAGFTASQEAVPVTGDPLHDLLELGWAYRRWAMAYPALYGVMFGRRMPCPSDACGRSGEGPRREADAPRGIGTLERRVAACLEVGIFAEHTVEQISASIWAGVHGWITIEAILPVTHDDADAAYERHMHSLVNAWRPVPAVSTPS